MHTAAPGGEGGACFGEIEFLPALGYVQGLEGVVVAAEGVGCSAALGCVDVGEGTDGVGWDGEGTGCGEGDESEEGDEECAEDVEAWHFACLIRRVVFVCCFEPGPEADLLL